MELEGKDNKQNNERNMKMQERNKMEEESKEVPAKREPGSRNGAGIAYGQRVVDAWNYLDGLDIHVLAKLMHGDGESGVKQWLVTAYCNGHLYFHGSVFAGKSTANAIVVALRNAMTQRIMHRRRQRAARKAAEPQGQQ